MTKTPPDASILSPRQKEVVELLAYGANTKGAAVLLELSPKTIESHRKVIKTKLNVQTSAQLSRRAFQWVQENS